MKEEKKTPTTDWDIIIEPTTSLFDLKLKDVWRYRDLLIMFVKRDFVNYYKQTILGPLWFFIQPLFTTIIYTFVFSKLAKISTDGLPQPLFYLAGITVWNYFADCVNKTSTTFKDNAGIFGKVYFPRLILPLSIVSGNLIKFGVQILLLIVVIAYYSMNGFHFQFTLYLLLLPVIILLMAMLGLGLGLTISAMTTKYRDLSFLVQFGIQLLMYATTVIYPLSAAPVEYRNIIEMNPMTGLIEAFRFITLGRGEYSVWSLGYSVIFSIAVLIIGVIIFNKTEKSFIDTV